MISRRSFLLTSAAAIVAPALPLPPGEPVLVGVDLASGPDLLAFAVGTPGEFNWQPILAGTPQEAFEIWAREQYWGDDGAPFDEENVNRVPSWDGKDVESITPADWIRAGMGHTCGRCSVETDPDSACVVGDDVVCHDCMTIVDWIAADADDALDTLANDIANDGADSVRELLELRGHWPAVEASGLWPRAMALQESDDV